MLKGTSKKLRFNAIPVAVVVSAIGILVGTGTSLVLANKSEAICEFSFTATDDKDYVTIDPASGEIRYNLYQDYCSKTSDVKYNVGYKATFQSSYTNKTVTLKGNNVSTGYRILVDQWGVRDYKIKLYQATYADRTTGKLKLKVT